MRIHFEYPVRKFFFPFFMIAFIWILFALPLLFLLCIFSLLRLYEGIFVHQCIPVLVCDIVIWNHGRERKKEWERLWMWTSVRSTECKFYARNEMEIKRMKNCLTHIIWWLRYKRKNIIWQMDGWIPISPISPISHSISDKMNENFSFILMTLC